MPYVLANTSMENQKLYAFDVLSTEKPKHWELVRIEPINYDVDGSILLTSNTLEQLKEKRVAVFDTKKAAQSEYAALGISNCRYVELKLDFTKEYLEHCGKSSSSWTDLNR